MKNNHIKNIFRIIAFLEGTSYILLLLAMPIKYIYDNEKYVQILGMPHGVLFICYVGLALILKNKMTWTKHNLFIILMGSIIPLGTFYVDYKYLK